MSMLALRSSNQFRFEEHVMIFNVNELHLEDSIVTKMQKPFLFLLVVSLFCVSVVL